MYVEGKKHSLDHPALLPEAVILDPYLLASLPLYHKKSCALGRPVPGHRVLLGP